MLDDEDRQNLQCVYIDYTMILIVFTGKSDAYGCSSTVSTTKQNCVIPTWIGREDTWGHMCLIW